MSENELKKLPRQILSWVKASPERRGAVIIVILALVVGAIFMSQRTSVTEDDKVVQKVGRHMVLPQNEKAVILTVDDKSQLNQPVLGQAENGDKLLIYQESKRAILYRPSDDQIIDVIPVE